MAWVSGPELVVAVSQAGGLGTLGAGNMDTGTLREKIRQIKEKTQRNFGVNVILLNPNIKEQLKVIIEEKVPVVTLGGGDPSGAIQFLKEENPKIKVLAVVASPTQAKRAQKYGADAIIAEGSEAGGHIGELSTFVLLPAVVKEVTVPVIAAGGIVDGAGFAAALYLGAFGIQMGTRFIASEECPVHPAYKQSIISATANDITVTGRLIGLPTRVLKNKFSKEYRDKEKKLFLESKDLKKAKLEIEEFALGRLRKAAVEGDIENGSVMLG
jgi:enoyl-[acyl-carrier protein] reductase II